jgi:hypothetical protein
LIWQLTILLALVVGAVATSEIGYRLGRFIGPQDEAFAKQLGVIQGATFALVAFLIGFAFSGAGSRYVDRLDLVVKEANALGTAYLRADALAPPASAELKSVLRDYTADRISLLGLGNHATLPERLARVGAFQERMWGAAMRGTAGNPQLMLVVLPPINDVIDLHTTHLSAARRSIPLAILAMLLATAGLALGLSGFGNGQIGRRFTTLNFVYGFILAAALWMTIDLDHPFRGVIQASGQPLIDALAAMKS